MNKLAIAGVLAVCSCLAAVPPLFENGRSVWSIVVSKDASKPETYAAYELHKFLKQISEAELPIVTESPAASPAVVIGTLASLPELGRMGVAAGATEQIVVRTSGNRLYLGGNMPRAALYAVYSFLQTELGCRWFWPGEKGAFIPKRADFELPELDRMLVPAFMYRELTPCGMHFHVPTEAWFARNFLNRGSRTPEIRDSMGLLRAGGGHRVCVSSKEFDAHPEWFSLLDGKRAKTGNAGCWSNPEFTRQVVDHVVEYAKTYNLEHLNIFPADITQRCACPACTAEPDVSTRWYTYYNLLIGEIHKQLPDVTFGGIAYQEYRTVPTAQPAPLQYIQHCQYSRCYVHKLDDPNCSLNKKTMDELKRWLKLTPMGIYGYEFDAFTPCMYQPCWNMIQDEMRKFRDLGIVYMKTELSVGYPKGKPRSEEPQQRHRMTNYLYAQQCMNPDADVDALIDDWCSYVYGAAAPQLAAYHKRMAKAWDSMSIHLTYFGAKPDGTSRFFLNDALIKEVKTLFEAARKAVANDARALEEVELEAEFFKLWENYYRLASTSSMPVAVPKLKGDNRFDELTPFALKNRDKKITDAKIRIYWNDDALHLRLDMPAGDMAALPQGAQEKDVSPWGKRSVEVFLNDGRVSPYWQLAANPLGPIYDAVGSDKSWNPEWTAESALKDGVWQLTMTLPFKEFSGTPRKGDSWLMVVDANSPDGAAGMPFPLYHDIASGVDLYFSDNDNPAKTLAWISRPRKGGPIFQRSKSVIIERGWQARHAASAAEAETLDLDGANLIVIENYQNRFSQEFFDKKLVPAVKNGAVVMFLCYFWVDKLHVQFADESYKMKFVESAASIRRPVGYYGGSFATTPNNLEKLHMHTPSGYFAPACPDKWTTLLTQNDAAGVERPYMLARPLGRGMVVLMGDMYGQFQLLDNVLEYNKAITR